MKQYDNIRVFRFLLVGIYQIDRGTLNLRVLLLLFCVTNGVRVVVVRVAKFVYRRMSSYKFDMEVQWTDWFQVVEGEDENLFGSTCLWVTLEGKTKPPKDLEKNVKVNILTKTPSDIFLCLIDQVLWKVVDQNNSLKSPLYQKRHLYTLQMSKSTQANDHLDIFNHII